MSNQPTSFDSSDSNVRNIFIAGNTGREAIIARHIDGTVEGFSYRVKMINILCEDQVAKDPTDYDWDESFSEVHLVLFVLDSGRYTEGVKRAFDNVFQEHLTTLAYTISALVLTGCEDKDTDARKRIAEKFRTASTTKHIAESMGRGIYPCVFLDLSKTIEKFRESFAEEMKAGSKTLRDVARKQAKPISVRNVFQNKPGKGPEAVVRRLKEDTPSPSNAEPPSPSNAEPPSPSNAELHAIVQKLEDRVERLEEQGRFQSAGKHGALMTPAQGSVSTMTSYGADSSKGCSIC